MVLLQRELRRRLAVIGIAVEVNPSSNLLIGNIADLEDHPLWVLRPPRVADANGARHCTDEPAVPVCIGSDDPTIFATHTIHEYQLVYDALRRVGFVHADAMEWIAAAREVGMRTRFTIEPRVPLNICDVTSRIDPFEDGSSALL